MQYLHNTLTHSLTYGRHCPGHTVLFVPEGSVKRVLKVIVRTAAMLQVGV